MLPSVARQKWCPFARTVENRWVDGGQVRPPCIADACMMWRWSETDPDIRGGDCALKGKADV